MIQLPAYRPELNPIENLWYDLKSHDRSNPVDCDYAALEEASIAAWHRTVLEPEQIKTICAARAISD